MKMHLDAFVVILLLCILPRVAKIVIGDTRQFKSLLFDVIALNYFHNFKTEKVTKNSCIVLY